MGCIFTGIMVRGGKHVVSVVDWGYRLAMSILARRSATIWRTTHHWRRYRLIDHATNTCTNLCCFIFRRDFTACVMASAEKSETPTSTLLQYQVWFVTNKSVDPVSASKAITHDQDQDFHAGHQRSVRWALPQFTCLRCVCAIMYKAFNETNC